MQEVFEEFRGKRVLVVEDEYLLARELTRRLEASYAIVIGPVPSVQDALQMLDNNEVDVAILDVMLDAETSYPVANALLAKGIPFVFATATPLADLPEGFRGYALDKDATLQAIGQRLFGHRPH